MTSDISPRPVIIIPFGFPWKWPADCEKETATLLSQSSTVIAFLINDGLTIRSIFASSQRNLFIQENPNLFIFKPLFFLPFHRFAIIKKINIRIATLELIFIIWLKYKTKNYIFWTFSLQHEVFPDQFPKKFTKIYDCVDYVTSDNSHLDKQWKNAENRIIKHSDICFANSNILFNKLKSRHRNVYKVPVGFNLRLIKNYKTIVPRVIKSIPTPRIIYSGTINMRLNFRLMYSVAKKTPQYSYVFIGAIDNNFGCSSNHLLDGYIRKLSSLSNVFFVPEQSKTMMGNIIAHSTVGIIPYNLDNQFALYSFPVKTLEYLYHSKPILATKIHELAQLSPLITIVKNQKDFIEKLHKLETNGWRGENKTRKWVFTKHNSFMAKIHEIQRILTREQHISFKI